MPKLQRSMGDGHDLISLRFAGEPELEACYDDEARLTKGAEGQAVTKVQEALVELGYDIGPSGADGQYGTRTWEAVKQFKSNEALGWEHMGDVGPGTMRRLNELFADSGGPPSKQPGLSEKDVADPRIDLSAREALIRMSKGESDREEAAYGLLNSILGGQQGGIRGEAEGSARYAADLPIYWSQHPTSWQDAILVHNPQEPDDAPGTVFREHLRLDAEALDRALLQAWSMFTGASPMPPCVMRPHVVAASSLNEQAAT